MDDNNQPNKHRMHRNYQRSRITLPRQDYVAPQPVQPVQKTPKRKRPSLKKIVIYIKKRLAIVRDFLNRHTLVRRVGFGLLASLMLFSVLYQVFGWHIRDLSYKLSPKARTLVGEAMPQFANKLEYDKKEKSFIYNKDYSPNMGEVRGQVSGPKFTATFHEDPKKGIQITDTIYKTSVTFKPKYRIDEPRKEDNRLIYPLFGKKAAKVVTLKASNIKEDIILDEYRGDTLEFDYEIVLPDELEARLESDGSLGIYGPEESALFGEVSTGSEKDAELLLAARKKAEKNKLIFRTPAPFIKEFGNKKSAARTWYGLKDNTLTVYASGLKEANYPLSIDPSVYVETASRLMRGNNETNLDFDVDNELIQKGKTTGARFDSWQSTMSLPQALYGHATTVAGGYIYVTGGNNGSGEIATVYWAKFNTSTYEIESPNPGAGACANWCTNSAYDLPEERFGHSLVAYNGYLYVLGGANATDCAAIACDEVYYAKVGANGEPISWSATTTMSGALAYMGVAAYNNRMYKTGGSTIFGEVNTVEYANINPNGTLGSWTSTGMVVLPSVRGQHSMQIYNDRMYLIGGESGTSLVATVHFIRLANDGTMSGSWTSTTSFTTGRSGIGGNFSTIWGGYIYVTGGCTAINGSGYCTTIASDVQLASINADGTITDWGTISGVTSARTSFGFVGWRNVLYGIGGCTAYNTGTGACTSISSTTQYGEIKTDGEASTVSNSVASGVSPCVSTAWIDCDMPPLGNGNGEGGRMSGGAIINNGFIYYIGGCHAVGNNSVCFTGAASKTSDTISYSAIAVDGTLTRAASCSGTFYGSWCVDNSNTVNGSTGVAAFGHTIFNNVIYVIGGTTGTDWQSTVWRNPLNSDGSLGTWTSQTFTNLDLGAAKGYQYAFTRANPSSAGTYPGNLYVIGGCSGVSSVDNGLDCTGVMYTEVYKCNITTTGALEEADANDCTTSGQLQLDAEPGTGGSQGLGVMAGTVYANYIYLIGGQSPNESERGSVMYAKIDNSNNIVDADGETVNDNIWTTSPNDLDPVRRRGVAFGYNGYLYALAGYNTSGGGSLNDLLFAKVDVSDGSIGAFTESLVTVNARWDLRAIVNNGYVYTIGGCSVGTPPASCTSTTGTIQTFQLYNNYSGSPYSYSAGANLFTTDRIGASAAVLNGYMYIAGGCTSATDCTTTTDNVQYAAIGPTGALGAWANTTDSTLPAPRAYGQLEAAGGTLYFVGGHNNSSTAQNDVYYGTPSSGNVSAWNTATNALPNNRAKHGATVWNNRIYVVGGVNSAGTVQSTVYVSPSLSAGGDIGSAWSTSTAFNVAREGATAIAYANNLYLLGGYDGTNYLNDVQFTQINSDGTVDAWSYSTSLPGRLRDADGFAANGFMYLFGGRSAATTCDSSTIVAPISANTTIASGNNPTGVGEWYETNVKYTGSRYGNAAVYYEGKAYVLGGGCGATITYTGANRIVQTTLQSQPQIAKYSRLIDTDTDVFPTKWLMNGLDNSIGARWFMKYRSSTAATAAWGQETDFGEVTLGNPETYTPKDSGGTDTEFARYYYLSVYIDSTQAFGYPEDVTRGPTIADLSLFFTSDPSKRLRHGKTFTGGEQQPLDTPF